MDDHETWKARAEQAERILREVRTKLDGTAHDWLPALAKHRMAQRDADLAVAERCVHERMAMAEALRALQQSIASALFGAARDDERCPPDRINGAMIDALADDWFTPNVPQELEQCLEMAETFLAEEDKRHGA